MQVLLDGLNSAPPEELERLNSLMEEKPVLVCYEHAEGEELSAAAGTIHPDFRLFATSNPGRMYTHRLSDALYNRVIRIRLSPLGALPEGAEATAAYESELAELAAHELGGVSAGRELAAVAAKFHLQMQGLIRSGSVRPAAGCPPTIRSLKHAVRVTGATVRAAGVQAASAGGVNHSSSVPVGVLVSNLMHSYGAGITDPAQRAALCHCLAGLLKSPQHEHLSFQVLPLRRDSQEPAWQQDAQQIAAGVASFEQRISLIAWSTVVSAAAQVPAASDAAAAAQVRAACFCQEVGLTCGPSLPLLCAVIPPQRIAVQVHVFAQD